MSHNHAPLNGNNVVHFKFYNPTICVSPAGQSAQPARPPKLKRMTVPQRTWQPTISRKPSHPLPELPPLSRVTFDLIGGHPSYGIPILFLTGQASALSIKSMVQNTHEPMFMGLDKIELRILWPGYEHVDWHRSIRLTTRTGQLTRGELLEELVQHLCNFFDRLSSDAVNPNKKVWAVGRGQGQWSIDNIILLSIYPVHKNTFQAELQLYFPHQARADEPL